MRKVLTFRLVPLAALLFALVRVVIVHSAHVGPIEWVVVALLVAALSASLLVHVRRPV